MKLLIVTPWPLSTHGGGQILVKGIAEALASDFGFEVVVAAGSGIPPAPAAAPCSGPIREIRLPLVCLSAMAGSTPDYFREACLEGLEAVALRERPDAILYSPHASSCGHQAAQLAARLAVPLVLCPAIHLDQRQHTDAAARRFYRSADLVVCLTEVERSWLLRRTGLEPARVLTIGCGWDGSALPGARRLGAHAPVRLLTVGGYAAHKRLDHQVAAVAILRDSFRINARLTIAGALREPSVLRRLEHLASRRGLEQQVEFSTDVDDSEIARLHAQADSFLFTSASESFGLAVLESIGLGTLPIVYPHPVYRGLVEESGFGTVCRRSTSRSLARAVRSVLSGEVPTADENRLRWIAQRSWRRVVLPLADSLGRLACAPAGARGALA